MTSFKFPPPPPPPPKAASNDAQHTYPSNSPNLRGGRGRAWNGRGRGRGRNDGRVGARGGHSIGGGQGDRRSQEFVQAWGNPRGGYQQRGRGQPHNNNSFQGHAGSNHEGPRSEQAQQNTLISPESNRKRKWNEDVKGGQQAHSPQNQQPLSMNLPRAKAAPPPPVPSFGFSLPQTPATILPRSTNYKNTDHNKKRRVGLGLTNSAREMDESSGDEIGEDIDEEAAYALLPAAQRMVFEHEGKTVSLQTPAEIAAWIKDRRKHFPTQKRIEQKAQEKARRRANELQFLRKVDGKKVRTRNPPKPEAAPKRSDQESSKQSHKLDGPSSRKKATETINSADARAVDLGLGYDSESQSDDGSSMLSESSVLSSDEESSKEESEEESEDSDAAPEEVSAKVVPIVKPPPPLPKLAVAEDKPKPRICPHWKRGICKYKDKCKFEHPLREEDKKHTLYERLIEQQNEKADRLALDAVKWLGQNGFLG